VTVISLALLVAPSVARAQSAASDTVQGPVAEEVDAFREARERFNDRMKEIEDDTRSFVDLREVEFIDSTALGVLIETRSKLKNRDGFLLAAPGLETRRALEISGLDKLFTVHDTVPDALGEKG